MSTTMGIPVHQYEPSYYSGAKVRMDEVTYRYTAVTASTTLVANTIGNIGNCNSLVVNTSGANTLTLPTAVGLVGYFFVVKNTANTTVTLATTSTQTIDGASTKSLTQYQSLTVVSDGANWVII